jgi:hypothetical protein
MYIRMAGYTGGWIEVDWSGCPVMNWKAVFLGTTERDYPALTSVTTIFGVCVGTMYNVCQQYAI